MRRFFALTLPGAAMLGATLLGGCATAPRTIAIADPAPAPVPVQTAQMPAGGFPGMVIPAVLPDGSYPTPNRDLSADATIWHMRVALNVAALACRGGDAPRIVTGYNAMLDRRKAVLKTAEAAYAAEFKARGGDWRDSYDDAMTRLYNFFSQSPERDTFCATAADVLAAEQGIAAEAMPAFAAQQLPRLDRPFTDFYRAYDAWRDQRAQSVLIAVSAPAPTGPRPVPRLEVDANVFRIAQPPLS